MQRNRRINNGTHRCSNCPTQLSQFLYQYCLVARRTLPLASPGAGCLRLPRYPACSVPVEMLLFCFTCAAARDVARVDWSAAVASLLQLGVTTAKTALPVNSRNGNGTYPYPAAAKRDRQMSGNTLLLLQLESHALRPPKTPPANARILQSFHLWIHMPKRIGTTKKQQRQW